MMGKRISIKEKRKEAPEWVFNWRRSGNATFSLSKWIALLLVTGIFALLLSVVQIRVHSPTIWAASKATVIYTAATPEGRILTLRAREEGPFPSRFLPSQWEGAAALEQEFLGAARWMPPPYMPTLRDLPKPAAPRLQLAARGEPVLPKRLPTVSAAPMPEKLQLVPVISPLSGITSDELPAYLPPIADPVNATMIAATWRFLLRLDAAGRVRDCVSLAGGDEAGPSSIEAWLRRLTFKSEPTNPSRWIAVGVGFANQPTADGTDPD
jgi:hypothetical protein